MKKELVGLLACPSCRGALEVNVTKTEGEEITEGRIRCISCGKDFAVTGGIPRFSEPSHTRSFSLEWKLHSKTQFDSYTKRRFSEVTFFERTGLSPDGLHGRLVLDAGCGSGRYVEIAANRGATVVGVDGSLSVESAYDNLTGVPNVHFIQCDLSSIPLKQGEFDIIYSLGVLHHSPNPEWLFRKLVEYLAPDGSLAVSVYSDEGIPRKFANRVGSIYRAMASRVQPATLYSMCTALVGLPIPAALQSDPYSSKHGIGISPSLVVSLVLPFMSLVRNKDWRLLDTFDYLSPKYTSRHSYQEVVSWFESAGLVEVERLPVPVSVKGTKRS